ncbi:MAG: hypothetical protein QNK04_24920 [Myxococcota bacterium]|nr:hypothetical protein [Myxococcota bacterium]
MRGCRQAGPFAGSVAIAALALGASFLLALPTPARADGFDKALAEIDEALEKNPHNASPESLRSCRSMRKTAVLLRKMGHIERAVRRINSCRRLLGLDGLAPRGLYELELPWFG